MGMRLMSHLEITIATVVGAVTAWLIRRVVEASLRVIVAAPSE